MKNLSLILVAFMLVFAACKKDKTGEEDPDALAPTAAQKGFSIEYTSTTCGICGNQGFTLSHQFAKDAPQGVMITLHVNSNSDKMANNTLSYGFNDDRPVQGGIPKFYVGDKKILPSETNAMKDLISQGDAVAGIDIKYEKDGSNMKVETLTKFFKAATGDYYLSVYILEDGIDGSSKAPQGYVQAGGKYSHPNDDYKHDFVIRASSMNNNVMGEKIVSNPAQDAEISKSYTIPLDASWKDVYAVAVLWKYDASGNIKYKYVNSINKR